MSASPPDDAVPPKTTLFCPDCEYRSPVDGDWRTDASVTGRRLRCPACDAVVLERPRCGADWPWSLQRACAEGLRLWTDFWVRTAALW